MDILWKENGTFEEGKERSESLWVQKKYRYGKDEDKEVTKKPRPSLDKDIKAEVAVIGAGLAGVLTAYFLQEQGINVVVLECKETGSGMTKNTTAKITSQHGLIYRKLMMYKGEERTWEYATANQQALLRYQQIINLLQIDCDFEVLPNYIYTLDNELRIKQEVEAAQRVGLPAVYTKETMLPFKVKAAVRFDNQAQFHPLKFLDAVAKELTIYENTKVTEIHKNGLIKTDQGSVKADKVVIATHYPFINVPGYYFARLHQERHYLTALEGCRTDNRACLDGMYLDADPDGFTWRNYKNYLILGSGGHRTGKYQPVDAYAKIERAARRWYPDSRIIYTWSAQDCITPDSIPYIGRYSVRTPHIYVATGFNKWGMSSSMVSAMLLSDAIAGKENSFRKVFNPRRLMLSGSRVLVKDAAIVTISLLSEYLKIPHDRLKDIDRGKAGVIRYNGQRVGVYRDKEDKYYFVTTKCPHLGCKLEWNQNEQTWDCPCHGSRFDYRGNMINNPAMRNTFDACQRRKKKGKTSE
ncbi:FAD-dependent oxidoreductase [Mobilitalea sibirica]|uniref:FAD-dependent oxidoreductase n=1 Tax=Mobilitalea sibirica TaxID=1462919 RepID=A0A8J7HEG0_9FIRM|nr:FAD-dependent oxidoreductase [Mobilitalea sibirica]MBH1942169.1 FAD-dependent oxidoreductase [Mobilitalea sibirica]